MAAYSQYDESVSVLDLVRLVRLVDRHEPSLSEAASRIGWSIAKVKRVVSTARLLGIRIVSVRRGDNSAYYRLDDVGPFRTDGLRHLYRKKWL